MAAGLAALAGFVDALGFIKLGGYFVSFMSGNSTRFAVNFAEGGWSSVAILPLSLIVVFVVGVVIATLIDSFVPRRKPVAVLMFVCAMLFLAALSQSFGLYTTAVIFMVLAMGAENMVLAHGGEVRVGVTYMTGTLVKIGQKVAHVIAGKPDDAWLPFVILWLSLITGAVFGAICYSFAGLQSLWIAAGFAGILLGLAGILFKDEKQ